MCFSWMCGNVCEEDECIFHFSMFLMDWCFCCVCDLVYGLLCLWFENNPVRVGYYCFCFYCVYDLKITQREWVMTVWFLLCL